MGHRRLTAVAAAVWIAGLALLSFLPTHDKHELHTKGRLHSAGHLLFFFVAAALLTVSARTAWARASLLCVVAGFGASIEYLQHLTSGVPLEWHDIRVDLLGIALGGLFVAITGRLRESGKVQDQR